MANVAYDPNLQDNQQVQTDVLGPNASQPANEQQDISTSGGSAPSSGSSYQSDGNPYGQYGTPQNAQNQGSQPSQPSSGGSTSGGRKTSSKPSSGTFTNVSSYLGQNQQGAQKLGQAVTGKIQNTADIAKQNLSNIENKFQQGMEQGSLENWQGAKDEASQAFQNAAGQQAAERTYFDNSATMYQPTQIGKSSEGSSLINQALGTEQPSPMDDSTVDSGGMQEQSLPTTQYSPEDQALIDSNMARVQFGDGTSQDFATEAEAQDAIDSWNRQNPGYNVYGQEQDLGVSDQRLADILNAQYEGPNDLYEIGGYNDAYNEFQNAQALQDQALGSGFKGELLQQTFNNPNRQYSQGQQLLDDLLLGQGSVGENLQATAKGLGSTDSGLLSDELNQRIQGARTSAGERAGNIDDVRQSARQALNTTALGRESEVQNRINDVVSNWDKLPEYYRETFQKQLDEHNVNVEGKANYDKAQAQVSNVQNQIKELEDRLKRESPTSHVGGGLLRPNKNISRLQKQISDLQKQIPSLQQSAQELQQFAEYDPKQLELQLSQLEAEGLGLQGGEGLYNLLQSGEGINNLIKTADYDQNKLISRDEQSQLSRLQQLAELANDYGAEDSGIDFRNEYVNRDLAGTQSAMDALDTSNFQNLLQGAERDFRNYAEGANITGKGKGKATSGGALGTKKKKATEYVTGNLGDALESQGAFRNMYSDEGVDTNLMKQVADMAKAKSSDSMEYNNLMQDMNMLDGADLWESLGMDPELARYFSADMLFNPATQIQEGANITANILDESGRFIDKTFGENSVVADVANFLPGVSSDIIRGVGDIVGDIGGSMFGSSAGLKEKAKAKARRAAIRDYQNKVAKALETKGYANQFSVANDEQTQQREQDFINNILAGLDTTNL